MKICICGGGNLGHVVAGFVAAQGCYEVCILTRKPELWNEQVLVDLPEGQTLMGKLSGIYSDPRQALHGADIVLLCLPGFSIHEVLLQIKDYLQPRTAVGSVVCSTGFFFDALKVLPAQTPLFGFQRVPFIARTLEYGRRARLMGYKECLHVAIEHTENPGPLRRHLELMLKTPIVLLHSYYEVSFSNSNPLLHPARLYDLWGQWHEGETAAQIPLFYEEWTEHAASLYLAMDHELQQLLATLPVKPGSIPTVLDYYECTDAPSLARKLRSIEAFKGIKAPMRAVEGGFVPDFKSRYFVEDFPYGLAIVQQQARERGIATPTIDKVCQWGLNKITEQR